MTPTPPSKNGPTINGTVLGNDNANNVDVGETLTVTPASGTTTGGGTYSIDAAGAYTYTPGANFNGIDTFTYTVNDATTLDAGLVSITVSAVNDPVVAVDDTNTAVEDGPTINGTVLGNDNANNVDVGETLTVTPASGTTTGGGTYSIDAAGAYTYTPGANFNGIDTFTYTVNDATTSDTGLVSITVSAVNDPVVAVDDTNTAVEDGPTINGTVLGNDNANNVDVGETLTVTPASGTTTGGGTYSIDAAGAYTYTPGANFNGIDTFTYTVNDATTSDTGLVSITVSAVNDPVVAVDDTHTAVEDGPTINGTVLGNDNANNVDVGETLTVTPASGTTTGGGTYSIDAAGAYTYTPGANFNGIDTFTYTVNDATTSDTGLVSITVSAVNDPVVAVDDTNTAVEDGPTINGTVLGNDNANNVDVGETLTVTPASGTTTGGGTYSIDAAGAYTYTPGANFNGIDTFTYTVNDATTSDTGLVSITVSAVNDPVVAVDDTNTAVEDGPTINGTVLGNDNANNVDVGETLTVTPASGTTTGGGTYSIDAAGAYTYTPGANFNGIDTFTYTVNDATRPQTPGWCRSPCPRSTTPSWPSMTPTPPSKTAPPSTAPCWATTTPTTSMSAKP